MPPLTAEPRRDEFPAGASEWPAGLSRRRFLELMGASLALGGLGACNRPPAKTIVPYITPPERDLLDAAVYYATAMPWEGFGRGVLALARSARPTKLEGNPNHPDSLGATDILMQAAVLSLYDPDRSKAPQRHGRTTAWAEFEDAWLQAHRDLLTRGGQGFAVLTEPTTSPTELRMLHALLDRFPHARWFQHTPLARYDADGAQPDFDFARADVVLALDADFLGSHPSSLRYARAFASRRRIEQGRVNANRLYTIEPIPSITGSVADHHLPATPARMRRLLSAIAAGLDGGQPDGEFTSAERRTITALVKDLRDKAPNVLCVAGDHCDADVRAWADALNTRLRANGATRFTLPPVRSDGDARCAGDLAALVQALAAGHIETLVIAGANPAYTAPGDSGFADALRKVKRRIHLGTHADETAAQCEWHLPEAHFLETWSDLRGYDGTATIVQPLLSPLYASRSKAEFFAFLADPAGRSDYDLVRETWQKDHGNGADFEAAWQKWLNDGVVEGTATQRAPAKDRGDWPDLSHGAGSVRTTVVIRPDPTVRDGRWANHGWLQELPKHNTQLVWDNAIHVSPDYATQHQLANGDVVTLAVAGGVVKAPVWIAPGTAPDCVVVHLGYGRTRAGEVGNGLGFDAYRLRKSKQLWEVEAEGVTRDGVRAQLVSTHDHYSMEGRDIVRTARASDPAGTSGRKPEKQPSLFPDWKYDGYRWAMLIDLGTCIGCQACVIACQAENNIPVVGKDQVSRGREMHWIRVDRYFEGDPANPEIRYQPVPCMQCEHAPCEVVCPVAATVHSAEGLNDMVYNRCIGTRYCSNNCPYKVRRFNFLNYQPPPDSTVYLQKNPEVSVRARGVMEKCTYCVQRIDAARIAAERENRRVKDGELRTACQQACPTEAIVFGDLNDPTSRVRARKSEPTHYVLLEELNTQPRTTYLAKITNRNEAAANVEPNVTKKAAANVHRIPRGEDTSPTTSSGGAA